MKLRCALLIEIEAEEELPALDLDSLPQPVLVMGGGSNLLFTGDFPGTVLHYAVGGTAFGVHSGTEVTVPAGAVFDEFCAWAASRQLWGPENLSLIPGEVGASAVQNIGAYGVEAKDIISGIRAWDRLERRFVEIDPADCAYGYRTSKFKTEWKGRYVITAVTYRLSYEPQPKLDYGGVRKALEAKGVEVVPEGDSTALRSVPAPPTVSCAPSELVSSGPLPLRLCGGAQAPSGATSTPLTPQIIRDTIIQIRQTKLPDPAEKGSAGSFFCNPVISREHFAAIQETARKDNGPEYQVPHYDTPEGVKVPAAWMIEQCGFRGAVNGGAQVYPKQPLVIVNASGSATPQDIIGLEQQILATIASKYGITLHPEVEHI